MTTIQFIKDYKQIDTLRLSFNELAERTFGLNFEQWYQRGCWDDRYICYSYVHNDKIIANISVNKMDIMLNHQMYSAIQIGTVMTDPAYRNQGLSRGLMEKVIEEYQSQCSFMYLFANKSVLNFYPKFGFTSMLEPSYSFNLHATGMNKLQLRKLNINSQEDWSLLIELHSSRTPRSSLFDVVNADGIFKFYCLNVFNNDIYYVESLQTILIYQQEGHILHLYDLIGTEKLNVVELIKRIPLEGVDKVIIHYQPDDVDVSVEKFYSSSDNTLFFLPISIEISSDMIFPTITQA